MSRRKHYHVYVIELSKDVLYEARFKRCNPGYIAGKPCIYVGMTGLDPDVRFDKHKAGIWSLFQQVSCLAPFARGMQCKARAAQ